MTRPSDVNEGINQALEVAAVEGSPSVRLDGSGLVPTESATPKSELIKGSPARVSHTSGPNGHRPDCGDTGMSSSAREDVPEENAVVVRRGASESTSEAGKSAVPQKARPPLPSLSIESLAKYSDEGENGWNAWGRSGIAKKMQRIAAGGYNSVEKLIEVVEEAVCR